MKISRLYESTHISFSDPSVSILFGLSLTLLVFICYGYNRAWVLRACWLTLFSVSYTILCLVASLV
ncbi:MAG: hypothetical protein MK240_01280 [Opitutales bacterium]|nr:hypothetical protein [Opitutales bacterium]